MGIVCNRSRRAAFFGFMALLAFGGAGAAHGSQVVKSPKVPDDARILFAIGTDASDINCELFASVNEHDELNGALYHCSNKPDEYRRYPLEEVKKGITLGRGRLMTAKDPVTGRRPAIVILSAPDLDSVKGGPVKAKYLTNGITNSYSDYVFQVERLGHWTSLTSAENGHMPFNSMFLKKKTTFGQVIGIKCIGVKWNGGPSMPKDCTP